MRRLWTILLWTSLAAGQVRLVHQADRVAVTIDGKPFGSLYFGEQANKPFFHPLTTPTGIRVTRSFPLEKVDGEPTDHPHQKGLWVGTERLNGIDFWENDSSYKRPRMGRIVFKDVTRLSSGTEAGVLRFLADWVAPEGDTVVTEDRTMTFYSGNGSAHVVDLDVTLTAQSIVTLEDHQDAVLGVRLSPAFDEKNGGIARNAEGLKGESGVRGKASRYVDWHTRVKGDEVGVAILDHPANRNAPSHWHLRSFGFLAANPFGNQVFDPQAASGSVRLEPGQSLRLRYRVIVYAGQYDVESSWRAFAAEPVRKGQPAR